ncbi:11068_t:CDS:1 [Paraglomus brasilianum]|uniref:11068_t:CDS:1 n=1 Tax=Paraglomus brasilianum TaxID=144538 RepID=A0A9N9GLF2_9GLOM|nr:11068_t:CDS:1 [Paraglomus brasilianum]
MPAIAKIPETVSEYETIVSYLQSNTIPHNIQNNRVSKANFIRRCKKFLIDERNILYVSTVRDNTEKRRRVVPKYDEELRTLILERFHDQANHRSYHKTYAAISENHIGITQEEVQEYVNKCTACRLCQEPLGNISKSTLDFHEFVENNNEFAWLLTCVCTFSKFLIAVPMKNKDVFKILGSTSNTSK